MIVVTALSFMPSSSPNEPKMKQKEGFFLVGVLVFCFILIPVIALFARSSNSNARDANSINESFKFEFLAEGLAEALASRLSFEPKLMDRFANVVDIQCSFDNIMVTFQIQDHDGKIDINNAGSDLLQAGFRAAGFSPENAVVLQEFVEASRSNDYSGAEQQRQPGLPSLKHTPFERIEELNDAVAGLKLPPVDFEPYFTVYKRSSGLEYETASPQLKEVIDASSALSALMDANNGVFDYVDVAVDVGSLKGRSGRKLLKTYAKSAIAGEVQSVSRRILPRDHFEPRTDDQRASEDCRATLMLVGAPTND